MRASRGMGAGRGMAASPGIHGSPAIHESPGIHGGRETREICGNSGTSSRAPAAQEILGIRRMPAACRSPEAHGTGTSAGRTSAG